ncbi:MAG: EAL domain-containing protein [Sphingomonadales bacterium]|nr:EAL domain-containing protein [Sphingomonadales bacterium]
MRTALVALGECFRLRLDDDDIVRGQFKAFLKQIPLLYFILAANAATVAMASRGIPQPGLARLAPAVLFVTTVARGLWWWQRRHAEFSVDQIRRHIRMTTRLAAFLAATYMGWIIWLYPHANPVEKGHLTFFLAITQVSCIFCLMPVRSAALRVGTIGVGPFFAYFLLADGGRMWVEAVNMAVVGVGSMVILNRYNRSFNELIHSQRDLRLRQVETERLSHENRRIALTDALSGLPNRRALIARLEDLHQGWLAGRKRREDGVAILFADLDGFKKINDDFGHELGDALIRYLSAELAMMTPPDAMLVRMGGDEFAILFECAEATARARAVGERIRDRLTLPLPIAGHAMHVGASIGIAGSGGGDDAVTANELLRRADTAMYRVKAEGKSAVLVYDPTFDDGRLRRQRVEAEIRRGLDRAEFDVVYQPLVSAKSGGVVAVEALVRWPGRPDGPLPPDAFIDVAETSGLIHPLGLFVLRRACEELRPHADLRLNVNISPAQFRHPDFEREVAEVLHATRFPPSRLQIEITEGYLIDHPDRANRAIGAFRSMGVGVALDDFGSGFASIGTLRTFGFSGIKIDKSLAVGLGKDPKAPMLIAGMVYLANGLDICVTAEGVETESQATMLRMAGCHELQGFLFGRPARIADVIGSSRLAIDSA